MLTLGFEPTTFCQKMLTLWFCQNLLFVQKLDFWYSVSLLQRCWEIFTKFWNRFAGYQCQFFLQICNKNSAHFVTHDYLIWTFLTCVTIFEKHQDIVFKAFWKMKSNHNIARWSYSYFLKSAIFEVWVKKKFHT